MQRRPDTRGERKYLTQDPLYLDYRVEHISGGIDTFVEHLKERNNYKIPLRNSAYLLYHIARKDLYDPDLVMKLESQYRLVASTSMTARHCMGALYGLYRLNQGTAHGIEFWEEKMEELAPYLHVQEVCELMEGFALNRTLPRQHMRDKLLTQYKPVILQKWDDEVVYHQRMLYKMVKEFDNLEFYDVELWLKIAETVLHKKKINNLHFFDEFFRCFSKLNADPKSALFKKLDAVLDKLSTKHYTKDRQWRYSLEEGGRLRSYEELVARREEPRLEDFEYRKADIDQRVIEQAKAIENQMKRLRMAKLDKNLFDEIVEEMMKEKKTILEMQAELDVDEQTIFDAQERIAKKKQQQLFADSKVPQKVETKTDAKADAKAVGKDEKKKSK